MANDDEPPGDGVQKEDVVLVHAPLPAGDGFRVLRRRDESLEIGEIRALKEGKPIQGEVVKLSPREGAPRLFDVEVVARAPAPPAPADSRKGPAQVATDAYRDNWEAIFARLPAGNQAPN